MALQPDPMDTTSGAQVLVAALGKKADIGAVAGNLNAVGRCQIPG